MSRTTLVALFLLCVVLLGVGLGALRLLGEARGSMLAAFAEERRAQLEEVGRIVYQDLDTIASDLRYAGRLVQAARPAERSRARAAGAAGDLARVLDGGGLRQERHAPDVDERSHLGADDRPLRGEMREAVRMALAGGDELQSRPPLVRRRPPLPGVRHAAARRARRAPGAVALVVDTTQLFAKLGLVTADRQLAPAPAQPERAAGARDRLAAGRGGRGPGPRALPVFAAPSTPCAAAGGAWCAWRA